MTPRSKRAPVVEFVGLPGAGKSSLCGATASVLRQRGISVLMRDQREARIGALILAHGRIRDWSMNARHLVRKPNLPFSLAQYATSFRPRYHALIPRVSRELLRQSFHAEHLPNGREDVALLDHYLLQQIASLGLMRSLHPRTTRSIAHLMRELRAVVPDFVVHVRPDSQVAYDRLLKRRRNAPSDGEIEKWFDRLGPNAFAEYGGLFDRIVEESSRLGSRIARTASVDVLQEAASLASNISNFLSESATE